VLRTNFDKKMLIDKYFAHRFDAMHSLFLPESESPNDIPEMQEVVFERVLR